ncbi:hypothetical protein HK405_014620, partial [Cladochytrium tenue]
MALPPPTIVVAAPSTSAGKTTVALGVMRALARRRLRVHPFKVGPDFIDPLHHRQACATGSSADDLDGRVEAPLSINLDAWMLGGADACRARFLENAAGADVCVVEG